MSTPKIAKDKVKYISLEGGGGAGNGYMGAFKALGELNILKYSDFKIQGVEGFAGASAGAMTGVLLACGYNPDELEEVMKGVSFEDFFDFGQGFVPIRGGFLKKKGSLSKDAFRLFSGGLQSYSSLILIISTLITIFDTLGKMNDFPEKLRKLITKNKDFVAVELLDDLGIFLGKTPRLFIQRMINYAKARVINVSFREELKDTIRNFQLNENLTLRKATQKTLCETISYNNDIYLNFLMPPYNDPNGTTFEQFHEIFQCDLVVMGTNLETTKSHAFSYKTTPDFYVEDAVRISMGLPIIYKPLRITSSPLGSEYLNGVWVDGGYMNNSPVNIFDSDQTIGLRLQQGDEKHIVIKDLFDFLKAWPFRMGAMGVGESHLSESITAIKKYNLIKLDTKIKNSADKKENEIGLFDFKPPTKLLNTINEQTYQAVMDYFD